MKQEITAEKRELREKNRSLNTIAVLACLQTEEPEVWKRAEVVGAWVWVTFQDKPTAAVREYLLDLGFHWNHTRKCWQHACGVPSLSTKGDPRFNYGSVDADKVVIGRLLTA